MRIERPASDRRGTSVSRPPATLQHAGEEAEPRRRSPMRSNDRAPTSGSRNFDRRDGDERHRSSPAAAATRPAGRCRSECSDRLDLAHGRRFDSRRPRTGIAGHSSSWARRCHAHQARLDTAHRNSADARRRSEHHRRARRLDDRRNAGASSRRSKRRPTARATSRASTRTG